MSYQLGRWTTEQAANVAAPTPSQDLTTETGIASLLMRLKSVCGQNSRRSESIDWGSPSRVGSFDAGHSSSPTLQGIPRSRTRSIKLSPSALTAPENSTMRTIRRNELLRTGSSDFCSDRTSLRTGSLISSVSTSDAPSKSPIQPPGLPTPLLSVPFGSEFSLPLCLSFTSPESSPPSTPPPEPMSVSPTRTASDDLNSLLDDLHACVSTSSNGDSSPSASISPSSFDRDNMAQNIFTETAQPFVPAMPPCAIPYTHQESAPAPSPSATTPQQSAQTMELDPSLLLVVLQRLLAVSDGETLTKVANIFNHWARTNDQKTPSVISSNLNHDTTPAPHHSTHNRGHHQVPLVACSHTVRTVPATHLKPYRASGSSSYASSCGFPFAGLPAAPATTQGQGEAAFGVTCCQQQQKQPNNNPPIVHNLQQMQQRRPPMFNPTAPASGSTTAAKHSLIRQRDGTGVVLVAGLSDGNPMSMPYLQRAVQSQGSGEATQAVQGAQEWMSRFQPYFDNAPPHRASGDPDTKRWAFCRSRAFRTADDLEVRQWLDQWWPHVAGVFRPDPVRQMGFVMVEFDSASACSHFLRAAQPHVAGREVRVRLADTETPTGGARV